MREWSYTAFGPEVFDTRAECVKVALREHARRSKDHEDAKKLGLRVSIPTYNCLPDTVDPRGPRSK